MEKERTTQKYDDKHLLNMAKYQRAVKSILDKMCEEAAQLGISTGFENGKGETFSFDNFPKARKKFTDLMWRVRKELQATVEDGVLDEWNLSTAKNDSLLESLIGKIGLTLDQLEKLEPRRLESVHAFQERKTNGLGLSDRVWNITAVAEAQIAEAIEQNLSKGLPAHKLSLAVRKNLQDPDMMYRRYRHKVKMKGGGEKYVRVWHKRIVDEDGKVRFIESPLEAVGTGVYRSAYKNAMRLARTETNMAYHKADSNYFSQSKIILGIEIKLSNNHTTTFGDGKETKELNDICDELQGVYPRWFDFTGWHPNCRCLAMPITPDRQEMREYLKKIANGEDVSGFKFSGMVDKLPDNFRNWCNTNEDRLIKMQKKGKLPYFIRQNISKGFRFGYGIDIDDAMKWSPYDFEFNEDYDMLMMTEVEQTRPTVEKVTPEQVMEDTEAMIQSLLDKDLAQYAEYIQANIAELEKAIGQRRGLSMSWEEANTKKENPHYHDKVQRYERDEKGNYIWVKKGRGIGAKETKEWRDHKRWTVNCQTCTLVHELRRRGFNVEACGNNRGSVWRVYEKKGVGSKREGYRIGKWLNPDGTPVKPFYACQWARDNSRSMTSKNDAYDFFNAMMKNVGRYEIYIDWNGGSAHVFCAEKMADGKIHFFDPQSGKEGDKLIEGYLANASSKLGDVGIVRTDNKIINPKLAETFIPIGELPIELPNKPNRHDAIMAIAEARHASRTQEDIDRIMALAREYRRENIFRRAELRHAERTKEREDAIRSFWEKKKAEGEIRRRKERWDAAKEKRHAERDADDIQRRATERQDKIRISKIKIQLAQSEWEDVKDWLPNNPLDATKDPDWHLYEQASIADKLFSQTQIIKALRPAYDTAAAYMSTWDKYDTMLDNAKGYIINGDASLANAIFDQLDVARGMESLYLDMVKYAKAHPSKSKTGKKTKIEVLMEEADNLISEGDFRSAKTKIEEAKKVRDINEASNARKAAKRKAEEEARKKAEEEARKKEEGNEVKKTMLDANSADDVRKIFGDKAPRFLDTYEDAMAIEDHTKNEYIEERKKIEAGIKAFFDSVDFGHWEHSDLFGSIMENGIGNIHQCNTKGDGYEQNRYGYENYIMCNDGANPYDYSGTSNKTKRDGWDKNDYYRCGMPMPKDMQEGWDEIGTSMYGDCHVRFRKDKVVTTWTKENSLGGECRMSLTCAPNVVSLDKCGFAEKYDSIPNFQGSWGNYVEIQYHVPKGTRLSFEQMESVIFPKNPEKIMFKKMDRPWTEQEDSTDWYRHYTMGDADYTKKVLDEMTRKGVDIYYVDSKGKVKLYKKGAPLITQEEAKAKLDAMQKEIDSWTNESHLYETKDVSLAAFKKLAKGKDYIETLAEVEKVKKQMEDVKKRADAMRDLIPDVEDWNKKFTIAEIETAYASVAKFKGWFERDYIRRADGTEERQIAKLHKQMDSAQSADAKAKYKTWEIARDAYKRMRDKKIYEFRKDSIDDNIARLKAFKTKDKNFIGMVKDIEDLAKKEAWGDVEELITTAKNEMLILQQNSGERVLKLGESSLVRFSHDEFTQAKKDAAKWFKEPDVKKAYKEADDYMWKYGSELWKNLSDEERHVLWLYTDGSKYINDEMLGAYSLVCESPIDGSLRNGIADANMLTSIVEKAPRLKEAMWMQSGKSLGALKGIFGVDIDNVSDLSTLVGMEGYNSIFMSCHASSDGYFAKGGSTGSSNPVVLSIYMPEGTKGAYLESIASYGDNLRWKDGVDWDAKKRRCAPSDQVEFLLQRGAKLKITKAYVKDGKWYVDVDLIEQASVSALDESQMEANLPTRYRRIRQSRKPTLMSR